MGFFGLTTPSDMLEKAHRERARMAESLHVDNVYNFFVTVTHVADYVRHSGAIEMRYLEELRQNATYKVCRDLCDSGKHMMLTQPGRVTPVAGVFENHIFRAPVGTWNFGPQKENWMVQVGDRWVSIIGIADDMLELWTRFFEQHSLDRKPGTQHGE